MARRIRRRATIAAGVALLAGSALSLGVQQQPATDTTPSSAPGAPAASVPALFTGLWDYNDTESINAGTGRREQTPQSATARSAANNAPRPPRGASGPAGGSSGFENTGGVYRAQPSVTANLIRNAENFVRDLLEVPETLDISATTDAVTFVDDLARGRTYPTDGKGRGYRLSATKFDAKVTWEGGQLKREVEGGGGFKIFETYFLSDDGDRMFVIIRVKAPMRPGFVAGFNRVYDRVGGPGAPSVR
jgi:hypothetical protein